MGALCSSVHVRQSLTLAAGAHPASHLAPAALALHARKHEHAAAAAVELHHALALPAAVARALRRRCMVGRMQALVCRLWLAGGREADEGGCEEASGGASKCSRTKCGRRGRRQAGMRRPARVHPCRCRARTACRRRGIGTSGSVAGPHPGTSASAAAAAGGPAGCLPQALLLLLLRRLRPARRQHPLAPAPPQLLLLLRRCQRACTAAGVEVERGWVI